MAKALIADIPPAIPPLRSAVYRRRLLGLLCLCAAWLVHPAAGQAEGSPGRWQAASRSERDAPDPREPAERHSYAIEVALDPERHALRGLERIHFVNTSRAPLTSLYFHMYLNAFRDQRSVFMREGGARLRGQEPGRAGSIAIERLTTADGDDLSHSVERELVPGDFTQLKVRLPVPLQPGAALDLVLTFSAELPELVARAGYAGEFHMLGQWYPKLAKLDDDGTFVSFPYHGFGEFYADFADFTYDVQVQEQFGVAGSGDRVEESVRGTMRHVRFRAERVHDVAWAAYPYFETVHEQVGTVSLALYAPRGYGAALARQAHVLARALPYFEERYGRYPYSTLTAIIPPREAAGAAGMEYPTLFASDGRWWALPTSVPDPGQDVVAVHELAHQWFSGMIASNELAHPMLDEGLAQWSSLDFLESYYKSPPLWTAGLAASIGPFDVLRAAISARMRSAPSSLLPADRYTSKTLAPAVYVRPALVLARVGDQRGRQQLTAAISRYAKTQRFRHPSPTDLYAAFDSSLGSGYGHRVLRKALDSKAFDGLPLKAAERAPSPSGYTFLAELWALAFTLLRWLGP
ncbi:MAG: M1 family metallopeptidase [Polyangiales bacterium]